ncbi:hypothetical protein [Arthrobacter sp. zg-Y1110]|uniref:hypothetical protein n=1 Tax=Arthrobacter sp. zg-Y1110 TaxID=2886932 RepID=UPI001D13A2F1|nr:hypothetical protein [Arthrobacter sp. zg-Y1110]MCC3292455.1 hypothetical protein [Arthrobacter sp. zg-Y1110]UWX87112.1 hypothetical protein N2K99_17395 [Arthrobacter sp. zg-Y1110]
MSVATAPAAYTFKADIYDPACIVDVMASTPEFEGWGLAAGITMTVEKNLDEIAAAFSINRDEEATFDADEFPKAVFRTQLDGGSCGSCGDAI